MVIPTAEGDLDETGSQIRLNQIASGDAGVAESAIAVAVFFGLAEIENIVDVAVVHHQARALIPGAHLAGHGADIVEVAHLMIDILQQPIAGLEAGDSVAMS